MAGDGEEATTKPDHITVEIPSTPTATEEPKAAASDSSTETAAANIILLAAAVQNSNQQNQPISPATTTTKPTTPKTPNTPSSKSTLRKRFSVTGSGVTSSYPYPLGPDEDEDNPEPTTASDGLTFWKFVNLVELALAVVFLGLLAANLTVDSWKRHSIWELRVWKWCLLLFVILGGRLASEWIVNASIFLLTRSVYLIAKWRKEDDSVWTFTPREKFTHITFGLRTSFQVFIWFASVLLAWGLLLGRTGDRRSGNAKNVLDHITRALAGCLVGAGIWWAKSFLMELAAYDFIVERSRQRIVDSIVDQEALKSVWDNSTPLGPRHEKKMEKDGKVEKVTDDFRLKEKILTWTPPKLVDTLTRTELSVIVDGQTKDCSPERVARATANELFARIAGGYDAKYVDTDKVLASLKEGYKKRIPVGVEEGGVGQISRSYFRKWVIKIHLDRLLLLRTLNGRDNVVGDLNKIVSGAAVVVMSVVWLLVMGFLTTKVMLLIATQIVALNFMFNNTAKTIFEAIIFVFVVRPFDVGDLCSIDDKEEQVVVQDMNILSTIFKKSNGQTLFYPNGVLMTKCITNYYGIPETSDSVEFTIAARTKPETVEDFKSIIEEYLKSRPKHWRSNDYTILVEDVDPRDKSVGIYVDHVVNFFDGGDRKKHRQELIDEVNNVIDKLKIECHSDPQ